MPLKELQPVQWKRLTQSTPEPIAQVRVDSSRFVELLISRRRLTRVDAPDSGLWGLIDHEDGNWYLTAQQDMKNRQTPPR